MYRNKGELTIMLYFDNSATTKPDIVAVEAINNILTDNWGNPSSLHNLGVLAESAVNVARAQIAKSLKTKAENIYFTPSGTIADNMAIFGACEANKRSGKRVITTAVEHSAVHNCFEQLSKMGYDVVYIDKVQSTEDLIGGIMENINEQTIFVSVMHVNNETGMVFDIDEISSSVKKRFPKAIFHTDAIQSYMKIPINMGRSNVDLLSVSAHKVHGPKGIGALYVKKGTRILPVIFGGNQEKGMVSGTENVAYISGFGAVVEKDSPYIQKRYDDMLIQCKYLKEKLSMIDGAKVLSPDHASPYIVSVSFRGIRSEIMLHFLESMDVYVSSGSACSKGKKSRVLSAFGINNPDSDSAIRISMDYNTTKEDIDMLCNAINKGNESICRASS